MIDRKLALELIGPFEGQVPHMYLDTVGVVTCGVGCALFTPEAAVPLMWLHNEHVHDSAGQEASPADIETEWRRVHAAVPGRPAAHYAAITMLELPDHEIARLFGRRVGEFEASLQRSFPAFSEWPEPAQLATLDLAFNLGASALPKHWPHLSAALRAQDWRAAAMHSRRPQSHDARNDAVRALFLQAAIAGAVPDHEIT